MLVSMISPDYDLDVRGARRFEEELLALRVGDSGEVVVDLSGVNFVASSGLRVLLKASQGFAARGVVLVIAGANVEVSDVFRMSGFDRIMTIRNNV